MAMEPQQMAPQQMMPEDPMMAPEELQMLDSVITPDIASVLLRLLPELQEIIDMAMSQEQPMPQDEMGALGNM